MIRSGHIYTRGISPTLGVSISSRVDYCELIKLQKLRTRAVDQYECA